MFVYVSCTNLETTTQNDFPVTINLDLSKAVENSMNLSEISERVEYIPLQSTDSSLIGDFSRFVITQDNFFIVHNASVLTFDKYGKFKNSLFRVGNGPGEANAYCLTVDENAENVYVYDHKINDVKVYSFHGQYLKTINKSIRPPGSWIYSIGFFNNNLFVQTTQRPMAKYLYSCIDLATDSIRVLYKNYRKHNKPDENKITYSPYDYHYQITDSTNII